MIDTDIAWCHRTFNSQQGCSGERCLLAKLGLCYADKLVTLYGRNFEEVILTSPQYWQQPWKWELEAAVQNHALRIFCGSLMDINDRQADEWRGKLWPIIKNTPHLVWMLLSKVPERYEVTLPPDWGDGYSNAWLGASVLNSEDFRRNTSALRSVNAALRFLSIEPLMSAIRNPDLTGIGQIIVGGLSGPN
jgi:protein gp37